MREILSACPLDCFDACSLVAQVENGKIIAVRGNKDHSVTKGMICPKGRAHVERMYAPDRLLKPLIKTDSGFQPIQWDEALDLIASKMRAVLEQHGPAGILHNYDYGYEGLAKQVDQVFFDCLGGVTHHHGSLCWGAGTTAAELDFGSYRGHNPEDLMTSDFMILWGRNPAVTNIHFLKVIQEVRKNGGEVVLIDPFQTKTAKLVDQWVQIKPGTDLALALGMAHILFRDNLADVEWLKAHAIGWEAYRNQVASYTPEWTSEQTGLSVQVIETLTRKYMKHECASIVMGYGMQRYVNGGNAVRAIHALGATAGKIGHPGAGVTYANKRIGAHVGKPDIPEVKRLRTYPKSKMADFIQKADQPPVEMMWIAKSNPVVQAPDTNATIDAIQSVPFVVAVDMFMTDSAALADLVLPATSVFEEEDYIYSSMFSPSLNYAAQVVEPPAGMLGEFELFAELAGKLGLEAYPAYDRETYFKACLSPLMETAGVSYEDLKRSDFRLREEDVPWADGRFLTPSGKMELYSDRAKGMGLSPVVTWIPPVSPTTAYPYRLITPHTAKSTNSQGFRLVDVRPEVFVSVVDLQEAAFSEGEEVLVRSANGKIVCTVVPDEAGLPGVVKIFEGYWRKSGCVNALTPQLEADMGGQTAYYDTFVQVEVISG